MSRCNKPEDLELDKASVDHSSEASKTEGSHSKADGDVVTISHKEGTTPRRPALLGLGLLALLVLAITLPIVLHQQDKEEQESPVSSSASSAASIVYNTFEYTPEDNDQCPGHLYGEDGKYWEVSLIWALDMSLGERGIAEDRTFDVVPRHEPWEQGTGVVFNIETVPEALPEDLVKPILSNSEITEQVLQEAKEFYQNQSAAELVFPPPPLPNVSLEVVSEDGVPLVYAGSQGFLAACMMAFAQHLPLALTPDMIWTIVMQGFARHIDQHAEELRGNFVAHDGKKEIRIREDRMVRGETPPAQWEEWIFPKFSDAIGKNLVNEEAHQILAGKHFSTSTATTHAASEIVLMAAFKSYFEYTMVTACGIPEIRLEGTLDDWVTLRDNTAKLAKWMMPNATHGELWINDIVLPILDEFVKSYQGHVNYCFWQNMVKFRTTGLGSGSYEFLSGWLPTLFPYLNKGPGKEKPNPHLRPWEESSSALLEGPKPNSIPSQLSSVPVNWEYYNELFPLHFHAGFRGVTQEADGTLSPLLGWYVTNDPPESGN